MFNSSIKKRIYRKIFGAIFCALTTASVLAQTNEKPVADEQTNADENIELNIVREQITETNFARSTDVRLNIAKDGGLRLEVGVGVRAEQVNLLLRGIYGRATFRASLEQIKQRLEQRRKDALPNQVAP